MTKRNTYGNQNIGINLFTEIPSIRNHMSLRLFEIIAALIAGAAALLVLKLIGLVIKLALIFALLITLAAWLAARSISARFTSRNS